MQLFVCHSSVNTENSSTVDTIHVVSYKFDLEFNFQNEMFAAYVVIISVR